MTPDPTNPVLAVERLTAWCADPATHEYPAIEDVQLVLAHLSQGWKPDREAVAAAIHDEFGFNVLTDDLIRVRRLASIILALPTPAPKDEGWRPIESAPKDGEPVDLWGYWPEHDHWRRTTEAVWNARVECWMVQGRYQTDFVSPPRFTHWMRVAAPTQSAGGTER